MSKQTTNVTSRKTGAAPSAVVTDGGHSYTEEEKVGFVTYINSRLKGDADLVGIVPIEPSNLDIIPAVQGSILLKCVVAQRPRLPRVSVFHLFFFHFFFLSAANCCSTCFRTRSISSR